MNNIYHYYGQDSAHGRKSIKFEFWNFVPRYNQQFNLSKNNTLIIENNLLLSLRWVIRHILILVVKISYYRGDNHRANMEKSTDR